MPANQYCKAANRFISGQKARTSRNQKRVIVATGEKVVMEPTPDEALSALFDNSPVLPHPDGTQIQGVGPNLSQARAQLAEAQKAIDSLRTLLANPTR